MKSALAHAPRELDESIEHAMRIERLLQEVLPRDEGEAASADQESPKSDDEPGEDEAAQDAG